MGMSSVFFFGWVISIQPLTPSFTQYSARSLDKHLRKYFAVVLVMQITVQDICNDYNNDSATTRDIELDCNLTVLFIE